MRVEVQAEVLPPGMAGAWHIDAHATSLSAPLNTAELVSAVFNLRAVALTRGDILRTVAGRFQAEMVRDEPGLSQVVLLTRAPGLQARFGITARQSAEGGVSVLLHNSVHPDSWVGHVYFRAIEPFHHLLMEWVVLRRLRERARGARGRIH